jgi:hypothetical protein
MPTLPPAPATLAALQALQSLILNNSGTTFAALSATDAARYGVARAVYIGSPKDFKDLYLPQCQIIPLAETLALAGEQARVSDTLAVEVRCAADFTDWWAAEQNILAMRDLLLPLFAAHVRAGAAAGSPLLALSFAAQEPHGIFEIVQVAGVWYRTWSCLLEIEQVYAPTSGLVD